LVESDSRQLLGAGRFWGALTGPNPTDRGKNGSKRHLVCDGQGIPLAIAHTGANVHDSQKAIPLIDAIPPIKQPRGAPRKRPSQAFADTAYDAEAKIRQPLRKRGIKPRIAKRLREHGSGLGKHRWIVEAVFAWLFKFRRLRVRYEKRDDIHSAFLILGCLIICWNRINGFC
jgi:transposase